MGAGRTVRIVFGTVSTDVQCGGRVWGGGGLYRGNLRSGHLWGCGNINVCDIVSRYEGCSGDRNGSEGRSNGEFHLYVARVEYLIKRVNFLDALKRREKAITGKV